jgi:N-terminal domain of galactosyltransferase
MEYVYTKRIGVVSSLVRTQSDWVAPFLQNMQYPNNFWGWGGEDDEMQRRLERLGIQFVAPDRGTLRDLEDMTITEKMEFLREHKEWKCMVKWELKDEHESTWKTNGLSDLKYAVLTKTSLDETNHATKFTVEVKLNGNHWTNAKAGVDFVETSWKK